MVKMIMHGCNGAMGRTITGLAKEMDGIEIVAGIDVNPVVLSDYPVFASLEECNTEADVIVDFASAKAVDHLLDYCGAHKMPLLIELAITAAFVAFAVYMLYPVLYSDNARSKGVSDGYLSVFPAEATVGEVLDDFFANGKWENYEQDGVTFVHYSGECTSTQTGEKAVVGIYFKLNDDSSFEIDRMTMDGETMNLLRQNITLSEISNSYCNDHGIASSNALDELENALDDALADSSSSVSMAEPESETYTEDTDSDNSAQTATRSDRKVVSTNGMDTYSELSGEISVDVNSYEFGEMPESTKEYYLSYGSDFKTAWLNAMYTDVYEYSGKYSNLDALSRFIEYLKFYDEATYYMEVEGMIQDLHEIWYDFDIETLTEEDAGVYVDRVIQMAEANGAEIQIW